jgi:hypothetical protein
MRLTADALNAFISARLKKVGVWLVQWLEICMHDDQKFGTRGNGMLRLL